MRFKKKTVHRHKGGEKNTLNQTIIPTGFSCENIEFEETLNAE